MNVVPFIPASKSLAFLNIVNDFNAVQKANAFYACISNLHKWNFVIELILFLVLFFKKHYTF